jgi:hypothetical protein
MSCTQGYDILEDMYSPKTSIANFAHDLCAKRRTHLDKFMAAVVALMQQYVTAAAATNNAGVPVVSKKSDSSSNDFDCQHPVAKPHWTQLKACPSSSSLPWVTVSVGSQVCNMFR